VHRTTRRHVPERVLTLVLSPATLVAGLPLTVGAATAGWVGVLQVALVGTLCGLIPAALIFLVVRLARAVGGTAPQPALQEWIAWAIVGLIVIALGLLLLLDAPHNLVVTAGALIAILVITQSVRTGWKIGPHTALAAGCVVVLARLWPHLPVYPVGTALTALIGWSQVRLGRHTPAQVTVGALAGGLAAWLTIYWLGWG